LGKTQAFPEMPRQLQKFEFKVQHNMCNWLSSKHLYQIHLMNVRILCVCACACMCMCMCVCGCMSVFKKRNEFLYKEFKV
jgi:hypothetical protein